VCLAKLSSFDAGAVKAMYVALWISRGDIDTLMYSLHDLVDALDPSMTWPRSMELSDRRNWQAMDSIVTTLEMLFDQNDIQSEENQMIIYIISGINEVSKALY
ncbi:hypothetical protein H4R99_006068, partial [Coemansia sp. RSA 1722]